MGLLINGEWKDAWYDTKKSDGRFVRKDASFRNWITKDGSAGPSGDGGFKAEAGRYHLYVSHACPWAHRTMIFRSLKGLEEMIDISVVHWLMVENGWELNGEDGADVDHLNGARYAYELYQKADPSFTGRTTVPILWDKQRKTIVSNESSEIIRMFNSAFDDVGAKSGDYYPPYLQARIDLINDRIYSSVNNGVYRAGFATTQTAYEEAIVPMFETLDWMEQTLSEHAYLAGDQLTEADWRAFTTLVRFDPVYVGHFKCNLKRIADYPNLSNYLRALYQMPGVSGTVHMNHIKNHYYVSHTTINPTQVVPAGPNIDLLAPHNRSAMKVA